MSRRIGRKQLATDFKPNMSVLPPRNNQLLLNSPNRSASPSPPRSCVSSESDQMPYSSSPEVTSMVLVGCPRCLMYVMLSENGQKCPKCKSALLIEFLHGNDKATSSLDAASYRRNNCCDNG